VLPQPGAARSEIGRDVRVTVERPYLILYRLQHDEVLIVRILHGARDIRRGDVRR
jgi:plasmid stabilization system protein ParE